MLALLPGSDLDSVPEPHECFDGGKKLLQRFCFVPTVRYAGYGAHVAILARRKAKLAKVAEKARGLGAASVHVIGADVSDEAGSRYD